MDRLKEGVQYKYRLLNQNLTQWVRTAMLKLRSIVEATITTTESGGNIDHGKMWIEGSWIFRGSCVLDFPVPRDMMAAPKKGPGKTRPGIELIVRFRR